MKIGKGDWVVFKEEIQLFKKTEEWEPPYGILLLTRKRLIITSEGKDLIIPYRDIEDVMSIESADTSWKRIYGGNGIRIKYRKKGRLKSTPVFSSSSGLYAGTLGYARDKRTALVLRKIKQHIRKWKKGV